MSEVFDKKTIPDPLRRVGINISGVADGAEWQHVLPGCRSVQVFANGGRFFWDSFVEELRVHPERLRLSNHPLDDFLDRAIKTADLEMDAETRRRWVSASASADIFVDFRKLAISAGIGWRSHMGLIIHPQYGLWISLRAALFSTEAITPDMPLVPSSPCDSCVKHCASYCRGSAFDLEGLNISRCAVFHQHDEACFDSCLSRQKCPIGADQAHGALQHRYHSNPSSGRPELAKFLGVSDSRSVAPLPWKDWSVD